MGIAKSRGDTKAPQINLNFCHFSAYFEPFLTCSRCSRCSQPCTIKPDAREERKQGSPAPPTDKDGSQSGTQRGKREREKGNEKPTSPQKGYPPHRHGAGSRSPPQFFAPKNQQKVTWVDLKKFSEKFFGGMFRGKENPSRYLNGRGDDCLINLVMKIVK